VESRDAPNTFFLPRIALQMTPQPGPAGPIGLCSPYNLAGELEHGIALMVQQLRQGERQLKVANLQAARIHQQRHEVAQELPAAQRARRRSKECWRDAERETRQELHKQQEHVRDNQGLRRSFHQLQRRFGTTNDEVLDKMDNAAQVDEIKEVLEIEEDSLRQTIDSMGDVQQRLESRVLSERDKRLRLKACAKVKLQQVDTERQRLTNQEQQALYSLRSLHDSGLPMSKRKVLSKSWPDAGTLRMLQVRKQIKSRRPTTSN